MDTNTNQLQNQPQTTSIHGDEMSKVQAVVNPPMINNNIIDKPELNKLDNVHDDDEKKKQDKKGKKYLAGIIAVTLVIIILAAYIAGQRTSMFGRAEYRGTLLPLTGISLENSYVFASPVEAISDGGSAIRITVFLLNGQGLGIQGQTVILKHDPILKINIVQGTTDAFGRAIYDLTSEKPGGYSISAETGNVTLPQSVTINFK